MTSTQPSIQDILRFSRLLFALQNIIRVVDVPGRDARENDVEHSYHLAMVAWYMNTAGHLGYDTDRLIRYALVHDIAEAYAGDVYAFDEVGRAGKAEREHAALEQMRRDIPHFEPFYDTVLEYERKDNDESRMIYALDKIMPILAIYLEGGKTWRKEQLTWQMLYDNKVDKVVLSPPVQAAFEQLFDAIKSEPWLFDGVMKSR